MVACTMCRGEVIGIVISSAVLLSFKQCIAKFNLIMCTIIYISYFRFWYFQGKKEMRIWRKILIEMFWKKLKIWKRWSKGLKEGLNKWRWDYFNLIAKYNLLWYTWSDCSLMRVNLLNDDEDLFGWLKKLQRRQNLL